MPEWYESFFTELAVDFWRAAVPPSAAKAEADFLERELQVRPPARLLDLPCGTGRHVAELRARGFDVTGFDLSPVAVEGVAHCHVGDMRDRVQGGPYDAAYCFGNSFGYLAPDDTLRFMRNVREAVKPGGRWAIDSGVIAEAALPYPPTERTLEAGGVTFTIAGRYDEAARTIVQRAALVRGGARQDSEIRYRVHPLAEVRGMLEQSGWRVVAAYGGLDGKPFGPGDRRVLLIAETA